MSDAALSQIDHRGMGGGVFFNGAPPMGRQVVMHIAVVFGSQPLPFIAPAGSSVSLPYFWAPPSRASFLLSAFPEMPLCAP